MTIDKSIFLSGVTSKYPEELLEKRLEIEANVCAALFYDILLLDEYNFTKDMFITQDGRFYFGLAKHLRSKGISSVDEVSILSSCTDTMIQKYEEKGGYGTIENMCSIINMNNWDVYCDELYKANVILRLYREGYNLFTEVDYNGHTVIPIKLFKKLTAEQVMDFYEAQLSSYEIGQSSSILEESEIYFDDDWIDSLEEQVDLGTFYDTAGEDINGKEIKCFPWLSKQTLGLARRAVSMVGGFSSSGKSTYFVTIIMALLYRGEKVLIISNEENLQKFRIKFMIFLIARYNGYYSLTKSKLTAGQLTDEDKKQIKIAQKYFNDNYKGRLKFIATNTMDIAIIRKKIREAALKWGCTTYFVDTFKISEQDISAARQDLSIVRDSRELHRLAMKYNLIGMASVQLAEHARGTLTLSAASLSNSKQLKEILELLCLLRPAFDEELDPKSKYYCNPFRLEKLDNGKWQEVPFEPDRTATWRILSVEKNRQGMDTSSNGVSYLLKFDGAHSTFAEMGYCRTKHGQIV